MEQWPKVGDNCDYSVGLKSLKAFETELIKITYII